MVWTDRCRTIATGRTASRRVLHVGVWLQPPAIGGEGLDRVVVVLNASGLESFDLELARARDYDLDGVPVKVLPLARVIVSTRAAQRPKDSAQISVLEATLAVRRARGDDNEEGKPKV